MDWIYSAFTHTVNTVLATILLSFCLSRAVWFFGHVVTFAMSVIAVVCVMAQCLRFSFVVFRSGSDKRSTFLVKIFRLFYLHSRVPALSSLTRLVYFAFFLSVYLLPFVYSHHIYLHSVMAPAVFSIRFFLLSCG